MQKHAKIFIKVNDIKNENGVRDVAVNKRNCRFPDENNLDIYPVYSTSGCLVNCRKNLQLSYCNCTSFFMPGIGKNIHYYICITTEKFKKNYFLCMF